MCQSKAINFKKDGKRKEGRLEMRKKVERERDKERERQRDPIVQFRSSILPG